MNLKISSAVGETGDASHINADPDKGLPHKEPFRAVIEEWIETYSPVKK
ncbi:MAG: hypothetical protein JXR86_03390 [Spirochaetales bacterium]|nr:hypothetical protein [Spirochaetales bacterium]